MSRSPLPGDMNGDGRDDVIVGAPGADNNEAANLFRLRLRRLRPGVTSEDHLDALGDGGYRIDGGAPSDRAGGRRPRGRERGRRPDVLVGAHGADGNGRSNWDVAYVVFEGAECERRSGSARRSRVPDRRSDRPRAGRLGRRRRDERRRAGGRACRSALRGQQPAAGLWPAYVAPGKRSNASVDLATLGGQGFRIDGAAPQDFTSEAMTSVT